MAIGETLLSTALKKEDITPVQRFRFESVLTEKFGRDGLRVYFMINGTNTVGQIFTHTGLDERRLLDILKLMASSGVIRIEDALLEPVSATAKPSQAPPAPEPAPKPVQPVLSAAQAPEALPEKPKPVLYSPPLPAAAPVQPRTEQVQAQPESQPEGAQAPAAPAKRMEIKYDEAYRPPSTIAGAISAKIGVRLPVRKSIGLFGKLKLEAELLHHFGQKGMSLFSLINGERTDIELSKEARLRLSEVDKILEFLAKDGWVEMHALSQDELREHYGDEGIAISDVYGRDGIYIYELIDRKATIKDIIGLSGIEPARGVEIFAFIHKVLGIDIPLDREALYKQLGVGQ